MRLLGRSHVAVGGLDHYNTAAAEVHMGVIQVNPSLIPLITLFHECVFVLLLRWDV